MYTIHLNQMQFNSIHGLYQEERLNPQPFELDVEVEADLPPSVTQLEHTIDYAGIYKVIEQRMDQPSLLLETLASEIADAIHVFDYRVMRVSITIKKLKPPIPGFTGVAAVSFTKSY
jgi:dihydroneopterin aldolase